MYASWSVKYTFELGGRCITADYAQTSTPGVISVVNRCKAPMILSAFARIDGVAVQSRDYPGAFSVSFGKMDDVSLRFNSPGNYWIIKLGPIVDGVHAAFIICAMHSRADTRMLCRRCVRIRSCDERMAEDAAVRSVS